MPTTRRQLLLGGASVAGAAALSPLLGSSAGLAATASHRATVHSSLPHPDSSGIVWWDRWNCENYNSVVLARSGAGKSYFVKLEVLRSLYQGVRVEVIDPEDEYLRLADAVGGTVVQLGTQGVKLNPLDLPVGDGRPDVLTRRGLFLHTLVSVLLGHVPPSPEKAALDRAIIACYAAAGITNDPTTWTRPAPLLRDLTATLTRDGDPAGSSSPPAAPD